MNRELIGQSTRYGVCELLLSRRYSSVLDMYYFEDQVAQPVKNGDPGVCGTDHYRYGDV